MESEGASRRVGTVTTPDYGEPSSSGAATEPEGTGTPAAPLGEP